MGVGMRLASLVVVAIACAGLGCSAAIPEGRLVCEDATTDCPEGWFCIANRCYSSPGAVDSGIDAGDMPDAGADGGDIRDGGADVVIIVPPVPSANVQTSGGGQGTSSNYRIQVRIGAPAPAGFSTSSGYRARLGPIETPR